MKIRKRTQLTLIILLLVISVLGCISEPGMLAGTEWELSSLNGRNLIEDTAITLNFYDQYLDGEMGCNGYGVQGTGKYRAKRNGDFSLIPPMAITVQLCSEPEGIMEQEADYIDLFSSMTRFQREGNRLILLNATGEITLTYMEK